MTSQGNLLAPERVLDPTQRSDILGLTILQSLRMGADAGAQIHMVDEGRMSLSEMLEDVELLAAGLISAGLEPGERVGIWLPNSLDLLRWFYAVVFAGGSAVALSPRSPEAEIRQHVTTAKLRWVIGSIDDGQVLLTPAAADQRFRGKTPSNLPTIDPRQEAACFMTSGSTGTPKLASHSHRSFSAQVISAQAACGGAAGETFLSPMPMYHIAFIPTVHATLCQGRTWVGLPMYDAMEVIRVARDTNTAWIVGSPTMWELIMRRASLPDPALRLRRVQYGAAPWSGEKAAALSAALRCEVGHCYGSTESGGYTVFLGPEDVEAKAGSAGTLLAPYEGISIRDPETSHELARGQIGEICLRGPSVTTGYVAKPAETAELLREGWCHSGDLGRLDDDGLLWVTGRIKEQINRGGLKIGAREVEIVIEQLSGVTATKVFGVPDPVLGERVAAVVEAPQNPPSVAEIRDALCAALADYKVPEQILVVAELPRTPMAKVDRPATIALFESVSLKPV